MAPETDPGADRGPSIPRDIRERYVDSWVAHGASSEGVCWSDNAEHLARLFVVGDQLEDMPDGATVLDVGCGYGSLVSILNAGATKGLRRGQTLSIPRATIKQYVGIDMNALAIQSAKDHVQPRSGFPATFVRANLEDFHEGWLNTSAPTPYSLVACIGTLAWYPAHMVRDMLDNLWDMTDFRLVFSINASTSTLKIRDFINVFEAMGITHWRILHDTGIRGETMFVCTRFK